jgi:pimeloyl-ACP methyl ester carboxylesterase
MRTLTSAVIAVALLSACTHKPAAAPAPAAAAAPERFVTVDGAAGRLRVSDGGAGPRTVVLVHGLGADLEAWRAQLDHLRGAGVRAVAYDQRGHGGSDRARDGVYTIAALADDLDRVVRATGAARVVLVGHSMAGAVLGAYAGQRPEVIAGVVFVDAVGGLDMLPRELIQQMVAKDAALDGAGIRAGFVEMLGSRARPQTRERVLASVARMDAPAFAALRRSMTETPVKAPYARYAGPAVALEAAGEPMPFLASVALGVRRVTIPDVSHWLMMDDPAATNAALDAFLATVPAR